MADGTPRDTVTVLSIDGGGIRGLIPALVLAEIEARTGQPLHALFDLIAGTSTGGLLALGLTVPAVSSGGASSGEPRARYSARELAQLYPAEGPRIFDRSLLRTVRTAGGLLEEKYRADGLEAVLEEYFGEARLKDALAEVLMTAYALERREAFFFKRHKARRAPVQNDFSMRAVGRATGAAPTYFEPARVHTEAGQPFSLVDGGVFAGNPAMCAYAEAVARFGGGAARRVLMVSLGTGSLTQPIPHEQAAGWGAAGWARPLLDVVFHGTGSTVDYQLRHLLPEGDYYRFQVQLTEAGDALDDTEPVNLRMLQRHAWRLIEERSEALDALCQRLVAERA